MSGIAGAPKKPGEGDPVTPGSIIFSGIRHGIERQQEGKPFDRAAMQEAMQAEAKRDPYAAAKARIAAQQADINKMQAQSAAKSYSTLRARRGRAGGTSLISDQSTLG